MESCGDCSFLYSRQSRYYILSVSLQAQKIAYQSNQNDLAIVFINCYYFLTVSCLPASVVHVGSTDVFVKPFSNSATIVPPRRKSTSHIVAKVPNGTNVAKNWEIWVAKVPCISLLLLLLLLLFLLLLLLLLEYGHYLCPTDQTGAQNRCCVF